MRILFALVFFWGICAWCKAQILPANRSVDWKVAGVRDSTTSGLLTIDMQAYGINGDGLTPNDPVVSNVLSQLPSSGAILLFPQGNFLFNNTIVLPENTILKGQGAENTIFTMELGGAGHAIRIAGNIINTDTSSLMQLAFKDSTYIILIDASGFTNGDWVQLIQTDSDLVTSAWAQHSVGQIVQISNIINNKLILESALRLDYPLSRRPFIQKINTIKNVGIECLKIHRTDNTSPLQTSNIYFRNAVNCWVSGIESENCTFSHIEAESSSNISINKSYFHHAFEYGDGGRGYGVVLHFTTNECRVEDNVFEHLRHSMLLQAGANGNAFCYNYSVDPTWTTIPNNASGDIVLHGNYVYSNFFEQNICQNIVIDNSHGPNGPFNTFFRNRACSYGIFFSASNSPNQNFLGNEITNLSFPYSLVNYTILGSGHFIFGNNNKGIIDPTGSTSLPDSSYAYTHRPGFIPIQQWAAIGTPNILGSASIPACDRYISGNILSNSCESIVIGLSERSNNKEIIFAYPNPIDSEVHLACNKIMREITVYDEIGQKLYSIQNNGSSQILETTNWNYGIYFICIHFTDSTRYFLKILKTNH